MKGKKKKGVVEKFKVIPKVQDIDQQLVELNIKKKFLEEKYLEVQETSKKQKAELNEVQQRLADVRSIHDNENEKYTAVSSDFKHQKQLVDINYTEKLNYLKEEEQKRKEKIDKLKETISTITENHKKEIQKKQNMLSMIRTNMEELSKFFSEQLGEIQRNLSNQIMEISKNWEINISEHLKKYEEGIKKFDIGKQID